MRRDGSAEAHGLTRALRLVVTVVGCGVAPVVVLSAMYWTGVDSNSLSVDFHYELYPQAKALLAGDNPYPQGDFEPLEGGNLLWPPIATAVITPLTPLSLGVADTVIALLGLVCFAGALRLVGVTDWRVYGACALWPQVSGEMRVSHLTALLALLLAIAWRERERGLLPGAAVGIAIAVKFFAWPFVVWLAAGRRAGAAALATGIALASLLSVVPFTGLETYLRALAELGRHFDQDTYTIFGLLVQLGVGDAIARLANLAVGVALLLGTWRLRSFAMATAAALVLSPIVWLDYFALVAIPLAVTRRTLSIVWFIPLVTWGAPGTGIGIGDPWQIARVLVTFAIVLLVAACAKDAPEGRSQRYGRGRNRQDIGRDMANQHRSDRPHIESSDGRSAVMTSRSERVVPMFVRPPG